MKQPLDLTRLARRVALQQFCLLASEETGNIFNPIKLQMGGWWRFIEGIYQFRFNAIDLFDALNWRRSNPITSLISNWSKMESNWSFVEDDRGWLGWPLASKWLRWRWIIPIDCSRVHFEMRFEWYHFACVFQLIIRNWQETERRRRRGRRRREEEGKCYSVDDC